MPLLGDVGRVRLGSLKILTCQAWGQEQAVTSQPVPAAMPASPQWSFTVNKAAMQPTFGGALPSSYDIVGGFGIVGRNTSGVSQTLNWQINKNGSLYKSGTQSVSNSSYYTLAMAETAPLVDGTVYDMYVWCTANPANLDYSYNYAWAIPTRIELGSGKTIKDTQVTIAQPVNGTAAGSSVVGLGTLSSPWTGSLLAYPIPTNSANNLVVPTTPQNIPFLSPHATYKHFSTQSDSGGNWGLNQNTTSYPRAQQNYYPTKIQWRDFDIG